MRAPGAADHGVRSALWQGEHQAHLAKRQLVGRMTRSLIRRARHSLWAPPAPRGGGGAVAQRSEVLQGFRGAPLARITRIGRALLRGRLNARSFSAPHITPPISRRCGRDKGKQRPFSSPTTSWKRTSRTCALSLWKSAGRAWRSCYPAKPKQCATAFSSARRSPETAPPFFVTRAGWTLKASSQAERLRYVSGRTHAWLKTKKPEFSRFGHDPPWYELDLLRGARGFTSSPRRKAAEQ